MLGLGAVAMAASGSAAPGRLLTWPFLLLGLAAASPILAFRPRARRLPECLLAFAVGATLGLALVMPPTADIGSWVVLMVLLEAIPLAVLWLVAYFGALRPLRNHAERVALGLELAPPEPDPPEARP
jgi:hypothetical protein